MSLPKHIREVFAKAKCLCSQQEVEAALDRLAQEIHAKLQDENPLILGVMVGSIIPLGHLLTRLDFPLELDYVHATRYNSGVRGGEIKWKATPRTPLKGRTVLIVDDILDAGVTLSAIVEYCEQQGAKAIYTAVLVDKAEARLPGGLAKADFSGLNIPNYYVFGYGLDYKEYLRNAPGIYAVADEHLA